MKAVEEFDQRFYKAMLAGVDMKEMMANMQNSSAAAMSQIFGGKPGAAEAFAQMQKELAKIKGTRILEIQRMGGTGTGIAATPPAAGGNSSPATPPPPQNGGSVAGQVATDTATKTAAGESGKVFGGSIPGNALGGALMNAWGRHKAKPQAPPPPPPPAAAPAAPAAAQAPVDVTLMEMTTQTKDFSSESIPPSVFEIPSGYKQVPSPMAQMMSK
jgi:hypothetical protein